jgi:hypothetical protein
LHDQSQHVGVTTLTILLLLRHVACPGPVRQQVVGVELELRTVDPRVRPPCPDHWLPSQAAVCSTSTAMPQPSWPLQQFVGPGMDPPQEGGPPACLWPSPLPLAFCMTPCQLFSSTESPLCICVTERQPHLRAQALLRSPIDRACQGITVWIRAVISFPQSGV